MKCLILFLIISIVPLNSATVCGPNEVAKNGVDCSSDYCPEQQTSCSPDPCDLDCKCSLMYKRVSNGTCIPTRECPDIPCGENEVFDKCPTCSEKCDNALPDTKERCRFKGRVLYTVICEPACRCIDYYWRNDDDECVCYDDCPAKKNQTISRT